MKLVSRIVFQDYDAQNGSDDNQYRSFGEIVNSPLHTEILLYANGLKNLYIFAQDFSASSCFKVPAAKSHDK